MRQAGRVPHADDLPPDLSWERAIWWLYERIATQWRAGPHGLIGLDYTPALSIIQQYGWDPSICLDMLQAIELSLLTGDDNDGP